MSAALIALKEAVERGENCIGVEASSAFPPEQYADCLRAYGEWGQKPSLDAAVSLLGAVLPDWRLSHLGEDRATASGWSARVRCDWPDGMAEAYDQPKASRALLLAILSALIDAGSAGETGGEAARNE